MKRDAGYTPLMMAIWVVEQLLYRRVSLPARLHFGVWGVWLSISGLLIAALSVSFLAYAAHSALVAAGYPEHIAALLTAGGFLLLAAFLLYLSWKRIMYCATGEPKVDPRAETWTGSTELDEVCKAFINGLADPSSPCAPQASTVRYTELPDVTLAR